MMAYHPQIDGATEQVNQEIKAYFDLLLCSPYGMEKLAVDSGVYRQ